MIKRPLWPGSIEQGNIMRKTLAIAALAVVTITSSLIATTGQADAQFRRWGPAVIVGGIVAGALIAGASRRAYGYGPACYSGPRRCEWAGRHCFYNRFGDYICRGGEYRCWRPTICD